MVKKKARLQRFPSPAKGIPALNAWNSNGNLFPGGLLDGVLAAETGPGDIILDPLSNCGGTAVEILRLGRRAALIELNPVGALFAEVALRPVSLPLLEWAAADVRAACAAEAARWYATACPKCGAAGTGLRYIRKNEKLLRIEYACGCSSARLVKKPDAADLQIEAGTSGLEVAYWSPSRALPGTPPIRRRTEAALASLLHAVESLSEGSVREALQAAFAAALAEVCFRRGASAAESIEANPLPAFEAAVRRIYAAKQAGNRILRDAVLGRTFSDLESGRANVVLLRRPSSADEGTALPEGAIDFAVSTLPAPAGTPGVTTLQAAWLQLDLDPKWDIVPEPGAAFDRFANPGVPAAFRAVRRAGKTGSGACFYLPDRDLGDPSELIGHLEQNRIAPETVRYQPPPDIPGSPIFRPASRTGGYLVTARILPAGAIPPTPVSEESLRGRLAAAARLRIAVHGPKAGADLVVRAFYQQLSGPELPAAARVPADRLLTAAVDPFARIVKGRLLPRKPFRPGPEDVKIADRWRRIILDAETLAAGDTETGDPARAAALDAISRDGGTAEDACLIRGRIRAAEIDRRRIDRAAALLQAWGKALGRAVRTVKGRRTAVVWKISGGRSVQFQIGRGGVSVFSADKKGNRAEWGRISHPALEARAQSWFRSHPDRRTGSWTPLAYLPDPERISGPRPVTPPQDLRLKVLQNREVCGRHHLLTVELPPDAAFDFLPGQFFHILCDPQAGARGEEPLTLRRPISIHRASYPGFRHAALADAADLPAELRAGLVRRPERIDFLYRVVGRGTERLRRTPKGAILPAIGPLGNGFDTAGAGTAVIVAGGIGIAPLAALAETLRFEGKDVLVYVGAAGEEMLNLAVTRGAAADEERGLLEAIEAEFREIGAQLLGVCTDDGSAGRRALVTELLEGGLRDGCVPRADVRIYACGPAAMLRAVAAVARREGIDCQVSLEERMACGVGACYACTVPVAGAGGAAVRKRVCRDGPVFHARDILWKD